MMKCRICGKTECSNLVIKARKYVRCEGCGSICTEPECFGTKETQKARYTQHNNSLEDEGYRHFLEDFIKPVLNAIKRDDSTDVRRILDYGSGPEPALCTLLRLYAEEGMTLPRTCEIRGWDPFFAPDTKFFEKGADLVTCLEVAEHFENPLEDMEKLASACRIGGYAAIGTMLLPVSSDSGKNEDESFKNWWYRSDITHVAFYTFEGLKCCAEKAGLSFVAAVTDRAFLFRKTA